MNETYVEWMVKKKPSLIMKLLKMLTMIITVFLILLGLMNIYLLIAGAVFAGLTYFIGLNTEIEYEYLYVDRQLSIDKVLNRSRRKKVAAYELERMEILAPASSYHLDSYKNRTAEVKDYSSGIINQPDSRYIMFYDGTKKLIFEPNAEMVKAIKTVAPRKVFES